MAAKLRKGEPMNLQNLIDYCKVYDLPDPLSGISVPEPIDGDRVRAAIMMRCGLLEPIYPEPDVFRQTLAQWFDNRTWNFEHLIKIIQAEYSPIENTDRYSEHTITRDGSDTTTHSGSDIVNTEGSENAEAGGTDSVRSSGTDSVQSGGTDTETRTPNLTRTRTDEISAENASGYQPDSRHTDADTGSETTAMQHGKTDSTTYGKTDTTTYGKTNDITREETQTTQHGHIETKSYDGDESYTEHTHGNIGVTTNQQMITEELELIRRFNIYDWIAERVEADLFVMVY